MKKSLGAVVLLVAVLVGCGSNGGGGDPAPATQPIAAVAVPECSITSVPTDSTRTTFIPGSRGIELLSFRLEGNCGPYEQFVYGDSMGAALSKVFKNVRLMVGESDINFEGQYTMIFNDLKGTVTQDFSYQWAPAGTIGVPRTYSLVGDLRIDIASKTSVAIDLIGVQTHRYGKEPAFNVKGRTLTFEPIAGMELPIITSSSPAAFQAASDLWFKAVPMGKFTIACPDKDKEKEKEPCYLESVKFRACDMGDLTLTVDGQNFYGSGRGYFPDDYDTYTTLGIEYAIQPGETKTVTFYATPYYIDLRLSIVDIVMRLGNTVRVSPNIVKPGSTKNLLVPDMTECAKHKG